MIRIIGSFLAAIVCTYVLGAIFVSQGNIAGVINLGFEVTTAQRFEAAVHDVTHMFTVYLPVVAVAFIIALPVAALIIRYLLPDLRLVGYVLAGIAAMIALHVIFKMVFGVSGIVPTRTMVGLLAQGFGGVVFHFLSIKPANPN
ncbi:MAG: hypothetical protein O3B72_09315 [Proteobacteria bacterium]|nr:hypothetical protein [Pseudomonadota bacterium]